MRRRYRLAIATTHPIQYQAPFHAFLAAQEDLDVEVWFSHDYGVRPQSSIWGEQFAWDTPLLEGYRYEFLRNVTPERFRRSFPVCPGIVTKIARGGYDAVLLYGYDRPFFQMAAVACRMTGVPALFRSTSYLLAPTGMAKRLVKEVVVRGLLGLYSAFLCFGSANRDYYLHYGVPESRIFEAPHAVDTDTWWKRAAEVLPRKAELRARLGLPKDALVFGFVGQLIARKRVGDLIDAFARIESALPGARLLVVGAGPLEKELQRRSGACGQGRVLFQGFKNQAELSEMYGAMDVLVLPSAVDTWGLVVNEAMCFGLPVIVSDRAGCSRDLVAGRGTGKVFPVGNTEALAAAMRELAEPAARAQASRASLDLSRQYTYRHATSGLRKALEAVCEARDARA